MIPNIKQAVSMPASMLIQEPLTDEVKQLRKEYYAATDNKEVMDLKRAEIQEKTSEKVKKELEFFGITSVVDMVDIHLSLGTLLFDFFVTIMPKPEAPLAKHLFAKKCQDYAAALQKDEIDVPADVIAAARVVLNDDDLWKKCHASAWIDVKKDDQVTPRYLPISSKGIKYFNHVINAAIAVVESKD
jgi:hypothetical protein